MKLRERTLVSAPLRVEATYLVRTKSNVWYTVEAENSEIGFATVSGGSNLFEKERFIIRGGQIQPGSSMDFLRQDGPRHEYCKSSTPVVAIYRVDDLTDREIEDIKSSYL